MGVVACDQVIDQRNLLGHVRALPISSSRAVDEL
jgi:hypothetical protein